MPSRQLSPTASAPVVLAVALGTATTIQAQSSPDRAYGPVVPEFGGVYTVPDPEFATETEGTWRVVFDVATSPDDPGEVNPRIETLARFLNMHARAGVSPHEMDLALVVHGAAGKDLLDHDAYRRRFGIANPNVPLLAALSGAGVQLILCGQTAASRGLERAELAPSVDMALSAMTALVTLQDRGYRLIAF